MEADVRPPALIDLPETTPDRVFSRRQPANAELNALKKDEQRQKELEKLLAREDRTI